MIPIHTDTDTRNPIVYNSSPSITLNDPTDDPDDTYLVEDINVEPVWDAVIEPKADTHGVKSHRPRLIQTMITIRGWVKAQSYAALYDKIRALNRAFEPVLTYLDDSSDIDKGYVALDFVIPTEDTTNYTDGTVDARYYAASIKRPVPMSTKFDGLNARFVIQLRCADPRMYLQDDTDDSSASGASPRTVTISGMALCQYPVWPIITVGFNTAPSSTMTIFRSSPTPASGTLSLIHAELAGSKTLVIDMQAKTVEYSDGTNKITAVSAGSEFFELIPDTSNVVTFTNFPTDAVLTVTHRRALV
jgi:hypothetical protein